MKTVIRHTSLIFAIMIALMQSGFSQNFPVQAQLQLVTPGPPKISSLFPMGTGTRVNLTLLLTDPTMAYLDVSLSVTIEGAGLLLQTRPGHPVPVYTLQGGVPLNLGHHLEPYFRPQSLVATGNHALHFSQNGTLPEGHYTVTVRVTEPRRQVHISNAAQSMIWLMENEVPQLATPFNNAILQPETVQNIFLSWIPGHSIPPSPGNQIEYVLSLWEVPTGMNPDNIVNTLQPLQSHTLTAASMVWGMQHATLVPGRQYVWRVQAQDPSNEVVFKNQGRSVPFTFTYGQACRTPLNLAHKDTDAYSSVITWQTIGATDNIVLEYKPTAEAGNNWRNQSVQGQSATLSNLAPTTSYTYRVSPQCGNFVGNATPERSFTTLSVPPLDIECVDGIVTPAAPDGTPLLTELVTGQMIWAAGFVVELGALERVNPNAFKGHGIMNLPFFNFALRADLKDIQVNHSLQLAGGTIEAKYGEVLTIIGGDNDPNNPNGPGGPDYSNPNDTLLVDGIITDIIPGEEAGTWIVITDTGEEIPITPGTDVILVIDEGGNGFIITHDAIHPHNPAGGSDGDGGDGPINPQILCDNLITFAPGGSLHRYGFDPYKENLPPGSYEQLQLGNDILHLHWKSVAQGGTDRLLATPATEGITFFWQSGIPIAAAATQEGYSLQTGSPPAGTDLLLALCPAEEGEQAALSGAIAVQSYPITRHQLVIVPVGTSQPGFSRQQLQTTLNNIYAQAVVEWEVTFQDPLPLGGIDDLSQGITVPSTDYSEHMRQVWRALVMNRNPVPGASYIFVVPGFEGNSGMDGYMPLKSGYGFITPTTSPEVVAHELGHGAFNLRHTFSPHNVVTIPQGTTYNLMDYPAANSGQVGAELWKYQWDFIHDPEGGWFLWEDVDEGTAFGETGTDFVCINDPTTLNRINQYGVFYLPDGRTVDLGNQYIVSGFFTEQDVTLSARGAIYALQIDNADHIHLYRPSNNTTAGFGFQLNSNNLARTVSDSDLNIVTSSNDAVRVFVDKTQRKIRIERNGQTLEEFSFNDDCNCTPPEGETEVYFATQANSQAYVDYFRQKNRSVRQSLHKLQPLVEELTSLVFEQANTTDKDENLLGVIMADKLKIYELVNGRKFVVVAAEIPYLSLNQHAWNHLAAEVMEQSNLPSDAILITIPYVHCPGIGVDNGLYFFMPGLAHGNDVNISIENLGGTYINTQRYAQFLANNSLLPLGSFVRDVLANTSKQYIQYLSYINYRGEVIQQDSVYLNHTGYAGTYDYRLAYDKKFESYAVQLATIASLQGFEGSEEEEIANWLLERFTQRLNDFIEDNTPGASYYINHGLRESAGWEENDVYLQYAKWYRDWVLPGSLIHGELKTPSPAGTFFYKGVNEVIYEETLAAIDAWSLALAPTPLDWIADAVGFFYALRYKDYLNATIYGTSAAIPAVSLSVFKGQKQLLRGLRTGQSEIVHEGGELVLRQVVKRNVVNAGMFTLQQIDDYVVLATKQGNQPKVMLGLYDSGGVTSYISKAGNTHTYFDMGSTMWAEAENIVGGNIDEMWRINKQFIDEQKAIGKEFWFSHDPFSPIEGQFYAREINYLIDLGVTDFVQIGDLWKALW